MAWWSVQQLMWPQKSLRLKIKFMQNIGLMSQCFFTWHNTESAVESTNSRGLYKVNKLKWMHCINY